MKKKAFLFLTGVIFGNLPDVVFATPSKSIEVGHEQGTLRGVNRPWCIAHWGEDYFYGSREITLDAAKSQVLQRCKQWASKNSLDGSQCKIYSCNGAHFLDVDSLEQFLPESQDETQNSAD